MKVRPLLLLLLVACGKSTAPSPPPPVGIGPPAPDAPPDPPKLVDLLHFTPAIVALSSKVDNPTDFPEHIVDGKLETAWNGRTGDLAGGWIAFRVPPEAKVKNIQLTAGYDRDKLFGENVRIKRVRVTHDGVLVRDATLDPDVRGMQTIDLDVPGGDYKIEILDVARGTRADYKELCVSEIVVNGIPGAEVFDRPRMPHVFVGAMTENVERPPRPGVPPYAPVAGMGPWSSPDEFCAAQKRGAARPLFNEYGRGDRYPGVIEPKCETWKLRRIDKLDLHPPILDAMELRAYDPDRIVDGVLLRTERGWWRVPWILGAGDYADPGCLHASDQKRYELASRADGTVWLRILDVESAWMRGPDQSSWTSWSDRLEVCRVDAETKDVKCDATRDVAHAKHAAGSPDSIFAKPPFPFKPTSELLQ